MKVTSLCTFALKPAIFSPYSQKHLGGFAIKIGCQFDSSGSSLSIELSQLVNILTSDFKYMHLNRTG